ncbi:MAG: NADPH-dependent F420 reductase [Actinomycetota bacterium]
MRVAIVGGTAGLGYALAARLAHAGVDVVIGSRQAEKAAEAAATLGVEGQENMRSVVGADIVVVTVPYPAMGAIYKALKETLPAGAVVIDATAPLASEVGGKPTRMIGVWEGSAAQFAKSLLGKDIHLASGFHTVMANALADVSTPLACDILVCGDAEGKSAAQSLIEKIEGARYVDCGPLENARILESLVALIIGIQIRNKLERGAGIRITGLD